MKKKLKRKVVVAKVAKLKSQGFVMAEASASGKKNCVVCTNCATCSGGGDDGGGSSDGE